MRKWLRKYREENGLTQETLSKKIGISRQMVGHLETGKANPSVETAKAIADVLNFDWTLFFENIKTIA